jgi:hypothetical protein
VDSAPTGSAEIGVDSDAEDLASSSPNLSGKIGERRPGIACPLGSFRGTTALSVMSRAHHENGLSSP